MMYLLDATTAAKPVGDHLPPTIWVNPQVVQTLWNSPKTYPFISVAKPGEGHGSDGHPAGKDGCKAPDGVVCAQNWLITLHGLAGDQIFKVIDFDPALGVWIASWPD